jgi:predicted LPLAT superfamily acyltransferase
MSAPLRETLNLAAPDELYALLIEAHRGLSEAESLKLNAKLVLLLANHVGDLEVVRAAIAKAKGAN